MDSDARTNAASTVAVVDDEEQVLAATASLIRSFGYRCLSFHSVDAANVAGLGGVDCICSDVQMPGASGIDLARQLGDMAGAPPVILMTGFSTPHLVEECLRIGVVAVLEKPLDADLLESTLARAIGRSADRFR